MMMISNMLRFPFSMLDDDMENLFYLGSLRNTNQRVSSVFPAINIGTTDKSVDVYVFVPGMDAEALDIVIEKNMLSIEGERKLPDIDNEQSKLYRQERFDGEFRRVITLPESVDTDSATANYKDGVLHISIAKRAETQPRQIKVSVQ
jgi:HSP20 family protein